MVKRFGLGKSERLKSRKQIEDLFATGSNLNIFPIRVLYKFFPADDETVLQIGVSPSQKKFKRAVDRNRIKRLLREAYRLQKNDLLDVLRKKKLRGNVFFIYSDNKLSTFWEIYDAMGKCLKQLQQKALET
ncbi:MAG: ribonuclease P protein component [Chitinophagaceae bacterium]|nr:ribonuclease P protein component [Chitinophagaceae bacterium]